MRHYDVHFEKNSVIHVDGLPWQPNAPNRTHIAFQNRASVSIVKATVSQMCRLWSSPIINKALIKFDQI